MFQPLSLKSVYKEGTFIKTTQGLCQVLHLQLFICYTCGAMTDKFIGSRMNCTLLVICITCIANSSQMYSITNAELSSFPDDISSSEQLVMLSNTTLSKVDADDLQTLDVLARLFIIHSQLTEVPDLRYICDTLAQLSFQGKLN